MASLAAKKKRFVEQATFNDSLTIGPSTIRVIVVTSARDVSLKVSHIYQANSFWLKV